VVSFGLNDASTTHVQVADDRETAYSDAFLLRRYLVAGGIEQPGWLGSLAVARAIGALTGTASRGFAADPDAPRVPLATYRETLRDIAALLRDRGAGVMFLNLGSPEAHRDAMREVADATGAAFVDGTRAMTAYARALRDRLEEGGELAPDEAERYARMRSEWGVGPADVNDWTRLVVWDSVHPHEAGHAVIADALARRLAPAVCGG